MALYLGNSEKLKVFSNYLVYNFNLFFEKPIINNIRLLSSDNYTLKDFDELYLIPKEDK